MGPYIRQARYRAGRKITQEQLAAKLQSLGVDLDRTAISRIESGSRSVTDIEINAITVCLGEDVVRIRVPGNVATGTNGARGCYHRHEGASISPITTTLPPTGIAPQSLSATKVGLL